jgi:proline dehydrogenase
MDIAPDIFEDTQAAFELKSDAELSKAKLLFGLFGNDKLVKLGSSLTTFSLNMHLPVTPLIKWTVYDHFCGGETFAECKQTIDKLSKVNVGTLLNYGVELKETEEDFDKTIAHTIEALEFSGKNKAVKAICIKLTGFGRFGLYEKMQEGKPLTAGEEKELQKVKARFDKLCSIAAKNNVALYVDAEESWIQDPLDAMVEEMMAKYNKDACIVYNTFQLYRWDRLAYLKQEIEKAKAGAYICGVKIVRGAYMEKERERAAEMGYKSPIHENKKAVDKDFNEAVGLCLDNLQYLSVCIASQSEQSNLLALQLMQQKRIAPNHPRVYFSQLYGMGDNITFNQAKLGFNATKYLPYGPVKDVVPYLIRRAQENTSVSGQMGRELKLLVTEIKRRKRK